MVVGSPERPSFRDAGLPLVIFSLRGSPRDRKCCRSHTAEHSRQPTTVSEPRIPPAITTVQFRTDVGHPSCLSSTAGPSVEAIRVTIAKMGDREHVSPYASARPGSRWYSPCYRMYTDTRVVPCGGKRQSHQVPQLGQTTCAGTKPVNRLTVTKGQSEFKELSRLSESEVGGHVAECGGC